MADAKISALSNASALGGTEQLAGVQSGGNVNITPTQIDTYVRGQTKTGSGNLVLATNPTLTGVTVDAGALTIQGNQSAAAWTTNGVRLKGVPGTLTDTSSSGTVALATTNRLGGSTIAASSATTYTNYATLYLDIPTAGTNVTFTNIWSVYATGNIRAAALTLTTPLSAANGGTGLSSLGTGIATWLGTPSSANLASALTDKTGTGVNVFGTSPTISTKLTLTGATETTSNPVLDMTQTWNAGAVTFTGIKLNVTNTASASASLLMDLQASGSSKFSVQVNGTVNLVGTAFVFDTSAAVFNGALAITTANNIIANQAVQIGFNAASGAVSRTASLDTALKRSAANIIGVTNGSTGGGAIELQEMTAPAAGSTNFVRIYAEDNGGGKTRLMAIFPTGAAQQIAIEP